MKYCLLLLLCSGCTIASLDNGVNEGVIAGPRSVPSSPAAIEKTLHGDENQTWQAYQFTLMGHPGFQSCRLDDQILLTNDGLYRYDGGQELCGAEDNQLVKAGTWEVSNTQITFTENENTTYEAQIIGLTSDTLVVRGSYLGLEIKGIYLRTK